MPSDMPSADSAIAAQYRSRRVSSSCGHSRRCEVPVEPLLARRERADGVDEAAAGAQMTARGGQDRVLLGGQTRRPTTGSRASAGRGASAACPGPVQGGSTRTRSNAPSAGGSLASPTRDVDDRGAHAGAGLAQRRGAALVALDGHDLARVAHQRREVRGLAAGRGAEVEHALARLRVDGARDVHRAARLGHDRARRPIPAWRTRRAGRRGRAPPAAPGRARPGSRRPRAC